MNFSSSLIILLCRPNPLCVCFIRLCKLELGEEAGGLSISSHHSIITQVTSFCTWRLTTRDRSRLTTHRPTDTCVPHHRHGREVKDWRIPSRLVRMELTFPSRSHWAAGRMEAEPAQCHGRSTGRDSGAGTRAMEAEWTKKQTQHRVRRSSHHD